MYISGYNMNEIIYAIVSVIAFLDSVVVGFAYFFVDRQMNGITDYFI